MSPATLVGACVLQTQSAPPHGCSDRDKTKAGLAFRLHGAEPQDPSADTAAQLCKLALPALNAHLPSTEWGAVRDTLISFKRLKVLLLFLPQVKDSRGFSDGRPMLSQVT